MSEKTQKTAQTGARLVVRALEAHGVTHVFGVPGAKIDAVFNALVEFEDQYGGVPSRAERGVHCRRDRPHDRQGGASQ